MISALNMVHDPVILSFESVQVHPERLHYFGKSWLSKRLK
jgi:hypothetical protein